MDNRDLWIGVGGIALITTIVAGLFFLTFKAGRYYERRDLTQYFAQMTIDTYSDGYRDGFKMAQNLATKACDAEKKDILKVYEEDESNGRY